MNLAAKEADENNKADKLYKKVKKQQAGCFFVFWRRVDGLTIMTEKY